MPDPSEYRFEIDAFTPDTFPMARLAEYMVELAVLLGEPKSVHFVRVDGGSTVLVSRVDPDAVPKVRDHIKLQHGDKLSTGTVYRLNDMLRSDNARARLTENKAEVIVFPGRDLEKPERYPSFSQDGTLDGTIIRLGGRSDPVPVWVQDANRVFKCSARRSVARRLAAHIFENEVRLAGAGQWQIDEFGNWLLLKFNIADFIVLDDEPLTSIVSTLRKITGSDWENVADPWADLMEERNGPPETH